MNEMKENPRWDFTVKGFVNGVKNGFLFGKLIYFILFLNSVLIYLYLSCFV